MSNPARSSHTDADSKIRSLAPIALRVWIVVGAIVIGSAVLNVLGVLAPVIEFFAVGSLVAFVASPIVNVLEHHGVPRGVGALLGLVIVVAAVLCLVLVIAPVFIEQVMDVLMVLPSQLRAFGEWVVSVTNDFKMFSQSSWATQLDSALGSLANVASDFVAQLAGDVGKGMFPFISGFASQLFIIFLGLVLAYWLARDYPRIHREICTIVGEDRETSYRFMVAILSRSVGGYMRGQVITSVINGLLAFVGFVVIGHPYAGLMAVLTGLLHLIPVVGPWISAAVAVLLAVFFDPLCAVWTLVWAMVAQNITDNVISPKIMQSAVSVHPAMSLAAIVVGSALLGPLGMVVAIPLCAAMKGLFIFYFENGTKRQLVSYDGAIFQGTPFRDAVGSPVAAYDALGDDSFVTESELVDEDVAPDAEAMPRPELDNPWSRLSALQPGATGMFRNPFASDKSEQDDGDTSGDGDTSSDGSMSGAGKPGERDHKKGDGRRQ
ncbi:AI-2E family transporter [Collinsella sp. An2]|uniref:AI-2E family transporter n=1 Tax=Collinsella sp. An2 TaxID=1965585 RepID=UPI000B37760D|nr:AI-2E family transporter [Collinsella sp. An2]OUP10151.1 AI-2E family transporter [Collinsella sp. An2]